MNSLYSCSERVDSEDGETCGCLHRKLNVSVVPDSDQVRACVLIIFEIRWYRRCRAETLNVVREYEEYKMTYKPVICPHNLGNLDDPLSTTAILVACLGPFRALFTRSNRPKRQRISDEAPKAIKQLAPKLTILFGNRFTVTLFDTFFEYTVNDIALDDVTSPVPKAQAIISASKENYWDKYDEYGSGSAENILPLNKCMSVMMLVPPRVGGDVLKISDKPKP